MVCVFGFSGECLSSMAELTNCMCSGLSCIFSMVSVWSLIGIHDLAMKPPGSAPHFLGIKKSQALRKDWFYKGYFLNTDFYVGIVDNH